MYPSEVSIQHSEVPRDEGTGVRRQALKSRCPFWPDPQELLVRPDCHSGSIDVLSLNPNLTLCSFAAESGYHPLMSGGCEGANGQKQTPHCETCSPWVCSSGRIKYLQTPCNGPSTRRDYCRHSALTASHLPRHIRTAVPKQQLVVQHAPARCPTSFSLPVAPLDNKNATTICYGKASHVSTAGQHGPG